MRPGGEWARYPRCPGATAIGTAAVHLIGGSRAEQTQRRQSARAEQDERFRRTGYVGGDVETATAARLLARDQGYPAGMQDYFAHLCAFRSPWNFQGQTRLAQLSGVCRRTVQRYRARAEADGWLQSYLLRPGDMLDEMRAPVTRTHVVRGVQPLIDAAAPRRRREPLRRRGEHHQKTKRVRRRRPAVLAPVERQEQRVEPAEVIRFAASLQPKPAPVAPREPWVPYEPEPATIDGDELDELDRELASLDSIERWKRQRPPD